MRAFSSAYLSLVAAAYLVSSAAAGALSNGVCYSPWHHSSVTSSVVQTDFAQIKQYFSSVRTYHARFSGLNVIELAANAGISVAVGVQMSDKSQISAEIEAICSGVKSHASSVQAVYVGNENLKNGDFGTYSASELVTYINQVKACVSSYNIPVGSVQRINEWLNADDVSTLASACDVFGVNIYPFFTSGSTTPIEKLEAQWSQMTAKYSSSKLHITETGWPRAGGSAYGNTASTSTTQSFLNDFETWSKDKPTSYYFMMYDLSSTSGSEYEKYFGLADTSGNLQVTIPSGDGTTTTTAPTTTQTATTAPASTTAATATQATATQTTTTTATTATQATTTTTAPTSTDAATTAPATTAAATTAPASTDAATTAPATTAAATTATVTQSPSSSVEQSVATVATSTGSTGSTTTTTTTTTKPTTTRLRKHKKCTERV